MCEWIGLGPESEKEGGRSEESRAFSKQLGIAAATAAHADSSTNYKDFNKDYSTIPEREREERRRVRGRVGKDKNQYTQAGHKITINRMRFLSFQAK